MLRFIGHCSREAIPVRVQEIASLTPYPPRSGGGALGESAHNDYGVALGFNIRARDSNARRCRALTAPSVLPSTSPISALLKP